MVITENIKIIDIDMPFGSMVSFIFKWTFASLLATIYIGVLCFAIFVVVYIFILLLGMGAL